MSKSSGLGDNLYITGTDVSNDVGSISKISARTATLEVTGINKSAVERLVGLRDGAFQFAPWFNKTGAHAALGALPASDVILTYCRGTAIGNPAAALNGRQLNYDGKRSNKGELSLDVTTDGDAFGLEWGVQLTNGIRTDTTATNGTALDRGTDNSPAYSFGFESGLSTWAINTDSTIAVSSAQAHTGSNSLAITSVNTNAATATSGTGATSGWFVTLPGAVHTVTAWTRAATSIRSIGITVNWFTSANAFISNTGVTSGNDSSSAWTQLTGTTTAPATAAYGAIVVSVGSPPGAGEVHYIDDVSMTVGLSPFGAQAYLQAFAVTGTSWTATVQHSPDNSTWSTLVAFSAVAAAPAAQRVATTSAVHRYLRLITTGTFTNAQLAAMVNVNRSAVVF